MSFDERGNALIELLKALEDRGHQYVLVGGYAVSAFNTRFSTDLDIVVAPETKDEFASFLHEHEFEETDSHTKTWTYNTGMGPSTANESFKRGRVLHSPTMPEKDAEPDVPIVCPECDTTTEIPLSNLADSLERHNSQLHDGDDVAQVDPAIAEELTDIVAEDLGLLE
jgi:hypothetical protein